MAPVSTGDLPLVVDEYVIEPSKMPGHYMARLAIRFERDQYAAALGVAQAFLRTKYSNVVPSGHSGSLNGDQISVYFWASGPKDGVR